MMYTCVFEYTVPVPYQCLCSHQADLEQPLGHPPLNTCRQQTINCITLTNAHKENGIASLVAMEIAVLVRL